MKDIQLKTYRQLKIEDKNVLNCIDNPIAYAASAFRPAHYNKYFLAAYYYNTWGRDERPFLERQNAILSLLGLEMEQERCNTKASFVNAVQKHIDRDEPVFLLLDYYNIFYNKAYYKKQHITHGVIITGYDETNNTFALRERIIIQPDGLYYLQLTEDMVYDMWQASCTSLQSDHIVYYIKKNENYADRETDAILQYVYRSDGRNCLIDYIQKYNKEFSETDGFFLRRQYDATVFFFELIRNLVSSAYLKAELIAFGERYAEFLNLFINKAIKNMMTGSIHQDKMEKQATALQALDYRLFSLLGRLSQDQHILKNVAFGCSVTASSMVTGDIPYSGDKTVNGKYSDEEMMENHWVSNDTDRIHWIAYDLGQAYPVKKIVLYHIKCNVLIDYTIQGSRDSLQWKDLCRETDNHDGITSYYLDGRPYRYFRLYITNPSAQGNAARLLEFQAWV